MIENGGGAERTTVDFDFGKHITFKCTQLSRGEGHLLYTHAVNPAPGEGGVQSVNTQTYGQLRLT
jgi:hypothetical protein